MAIIVNDSNFEEVVLQSELPVLVDFWAEWCGPCKMMMPIVEEIATEYAGKLVVAKVDTASSPVQQHASAYVIFRLFFFLKTEK